MKWQVNKDEFANYIIQYTDRPDEQQKYLGEHLTRVLSTSDWTLDIMIQLLRILRTKKVINNKDLDKIFYSKVD